MLGKKEFQDRRDPKTPPPNFKDFICPSISIFSSHQPILIRNPSAILTSIPLLARNLLSNQPPKHTRVCLVQPCSSQQPITIRRPSATLISIPLFARNLLSNQPPRHTRVCLIYRAFGAELRDNRKSIRLTLMCFY